MIDAYEIGIQLLIQDDVSAGLAVINRGLAEVDRGIAATSARLTELVRTAQQSLGAAAVAGSTTPTASRPEQHEPIATEAEVNSVGPTPLKLDASNAPDGLTREVVEPPQAPRKISSPPVASLEFPPGTVTRVQDTSAPTAAKSPVIVQSIETRPGIEYEPSRSIEKSSEEPEVVARQMHASAAPSTGPLKPSTSELDAASRPVSAQSPYLTSSTAPHRAPVIASVAQFKKAETAPREATAPLQSSTFAPAPRLNLSIAPRSDTESIDRNPITGGQALEAHGDTQAATPRERSEASAGTIMLDGRLVGQWLMDHMAESASRPPSGTSFFDPRQTPAWNVAGNL